MDVIPVIDLKGGQVVHARRGERRAYQPIVSPLCHGSAPLEVVQGLMALAPFRRLYLADLDAIANGPAAAHAAIWARLAAGWPATELWIDAGFDGAASATLDETVGCPVLGSESQTVAGDLAGADPRAVLSLDFRDDSFIGPPALLEQTDSWPARVIVMTLARVGAESGPDLSRVAAIVERAAGRAVYAAGGVRHADDLRALRGIGAAGALVATALHSGGISRGDLEALVA